MAEVEIGIGAIIDIASGKDVDALGSKVDALGQAIKRDPQTSIQRYQASVIATQTTTATYLDYGGPSQGRAWSVRRVTFSNPTPYSAALTTPVVVFVTARPSAPDFTDAVDFGTSLPVAFNYGRGELVLQFPEHLVVGVIAGSQPQTYVGVIRTEEYQQPALSQRLP